MLGLLLLTLVLAVAPGCTRSLYGYFYRSADILLLRRINGYLDLSGEQETLAKKKLQRLHAWHRKSELPAYAQLLRQAAEKSRDGLDESEVVWLFKRMKDFERRIYKTTRQDTIDILLLLHEKQIAHLAEQFKESNEELEKQIALPAPKRLARRVEKAIEQVEDWTGSLSSEQKQKIRATVQGMPDTSAVRLRYRKERQAEFILLLRRNPTPAQLNAWFSSRFGYEPSALPAYYRGPVARATVAYRKFVLEVDGLLTEDQRKTARERLLNLAADLESWSR